MALPRYRPDRSVYRLVLLLISCAGFSGSVRGQAISRVPPKDAPPPPVTYHGLVPGVATVEDVRRELGPPASEAAWYSWKMLYPAKGRSGHFDAIHVVSEDGAEGRVGTIEAASVPPGLENRDRVVAKLGPPEFQLDLSQQSIADYSEHGVRFVFDRNGQTIGVAYFPHGYRRVHDGERRNVSLRHLRQGAQKVQSEAVALTDLRCGAARAEITPLPGMLGPERIHVHDPLFARAVVLAGSGLQIALVGGDIFGMRRADVVAIEKRLRGQGIDHLIFAMSHNHSAGDPLGLGLFYPADYVTRIADGVVAAVVSAGGALQDVAELRVASDELPLDGARVEGLFRNARNPGLLDPQIAVLRALNAKGGTVATIVHGACHVEGLNERDDGVEISADFPGYLCDELARKSGAPAIFLNGALGGMVSGDTQARTHEEAAAAGKRLAVEVERILAFATPTQGKLSLRRVRVELPVTNPRMIAFGKLSGRATREGRLLSEMMYLRLGSVELVTIPGELLPEVSFEILERMTGYPRLIVGLANDQLGYILPGYDFRAGEYEESMSVGPAAGPIVLRTALRLLERNGSVGVEPRPGR